MNNESYYKLLKALADAYPDQGSRRALLNATTMDHGSVDISGRAYTAWGNLMFAFENSGKFEELREAVIFEGYNDIPPLIDDYCNAIKNQAVAVDAGPANAPPQGNANNPGPNWDVLSVTINRHNTMEKLGAMACRSMTAIARQIGESRVEQGGLVVVGQGDDMLESIDKRFVGVDSKKCWTLLESDLTGQGIWAKNRSWQHASRSISFPDSYDSDAFAQRCFQQLQEMIVNKPIHDRNPKYPLVLATHVTLRQHESQIGDITKRWIEVWNRILETPTVVPILPLLYLQHSVQEPSFFARVTSWGRQDNSDKKRFDKLVGHVKGAIDTTVSPHLSIDVAPRLRALDDTDFNTWVTDNKIETLLGPEKMPDLITLRDGIFLDDDKPVRVRMRQVVDKIITGRLLNTVDAGR